MPSAQRSTKPQQSGIEWVTRMGSTSKGPAWNLFLILKTLSLDERNIPNSFKRFFISCSSMNKCISKFKKIWYNFTVLMLQPTVPSSKAMNYKKNWVLPPWWKTMQKSVCLNPVLGWPINSKDDRKYEHVVVPNMCRISTWSMRKIRCIISSYQNPSH